jgi:hypothetical protein
MDKALLLNNKSTSLQARKRTRIGKNEKPLTGDVSRGERGER